MRRQVGREIVPEDVVADDAITHPVVSLWIFENQVAVHLGVGVAHIDVPVDHINLEQMSYGNWTGLRCDRQWIWKTACDDGDLGTSRIATRLRCREAELIDNWRCRWPGSRDLTVDVEVGGRCDDTDSKPSRRDHREQAFVVKMTDVVDDPDRLGSECIRREGGDPGTPGIIDVVRDVAVEGFLGGPVAARLAQLAADLDQFGRPTRLSSSPVRSPSIHA